MSDELRPPLAYPTRAFAHFIAWKTDGRHGWTSAAALAKAQAELGIIPQPAADAITRGPAIARSDADRRGICPNWPHDRALGLGT
jgi:hypothetical protein